MANKYYLTLQAGRPTVAVGGKVFQFERTSNAGSTLYGVYATDDKDEQKILDDLVDLRRVRSITQEVYQTELKKKQTISRNSAQPVMGVSPQPLTTAEVAPPVQVESIEAEIVEEVPTNEHTSEEAEASVVIEEEKPKKSKRKKKPVEPTED